MAALKERKVRMSALPVERPIIVTRPRTVPDLRVEQGGARSFASVAAGKLVLFGVFTFAFFFSSSMAGQVMVEKARREGISATQRMREASRAETLLREQVQELTKASAVDAWAQANGFVPVDMLAASSKENSSAQKAH